MRKARFLWLYNKSGMTVTAAHSKDQLDYVANALKELLVDMNIH